MAWCEATCLDGGNAAKCETGECLILAARDGDGEARERFFARLLPMARREAERLCRSAWAAEDIVQTALLLALEHLPELRQPVRSAAWVRRIVMNAFLMEARRLRAHPPVRSGLDDEPGNAPAREMEMDAHRTLQRVSHTAPKLPPLLAEAFRLRVVEGLSTRQAAELLGVSEEVVRARLARARKRLREASS